MNKLENLSHQELETITMLALGALAHTCVFAHDMTEPAFNEYQIVRGLLKITPEDMAEAAIKTNQKYKG